MCLATPGRIVAVHDGPGGFRSADVDFDGAVRPAQLLYVPEAAVGEYVIVQAGFAIRRVPAAEAEESLRYARALATVAARQ